MANTLICLDCKHRFTDACPNCGSGRVQIAGDLHLGAHFVDVYIGVERWAGETVLIIKKPSGQEVIRLTDEDLLPGF